MAYTPKIATLSQGQYNEFFDNDTIVQIGSVLYNTKSRTIVAFVDSEALRRGTACFAPFSRGAFIDRRSYSEGGLRGR